MIFRRDRKVQVGEMLGGGGGNQGFSTFRLSSGLDERNEEQVLNSTSEILIKRCFALAAIIPVCICQQ